MSGNKCAFGHALDGDEIEASRCIRCELLLDEGAARVAQRDDERRARSQLGEWLADAPERTWYHRTGADDPIQEVDLFWDPSGSNSRQVVTGTGTSLARAITSALTAAKESL